MEKTSSIDGVRNEIYSRMSPAQKWDEVVRLRELAWTIKKAGLKEEHPNWTEQKIIEKLKKIFLYAVS